MADIKLENFNGFVLEMDFDKIAKEHAEELARKINSNISKEGWGGKYADSWEVAQRKDVYIVHSTAYQLSHLLENGHLIVNKKGGVGWSAPRPHIKPAVNMEIPAFIKDVENMKIDLKEK